MREKIVLITANFPFGFGESSFILPELPYLLKYFDITILSQNAVDAQSSMLDNRIKLLRYKKIKKHNIYIYAIRALLDPLFIRECFSAIKKCTNILWAIKDILSFYAYSFYHEKVFKHLSLFDNTGDTLFYSYWYNAPVLALLRHKKTDKSMKVITRVHRYDLFNESQKGGWQPFRDYMDKYIDSIVFISQNGLDYYLTTWKKPLSKKYLLSRLGVINDYTRKQYRNNETKLILSCSNIIPFKRINLIIEGLALIEDINIHWVHIGDGIDFIKTKKMAIEFLDKKKNIVFTFAGRLPIEEVYDFYKKNFVDLFITTSSSEGLPVSMMEALSFGVPVIGTNVGGIPEAVGNWGILLPSTPSATDVSGAISRVFEKTEIEREELSIKSKAAWDNYFNFEKNSRQFIDILLQI